MAKEIALFIEVHCKELASVNGLIDRVIFKLIQDIKGIEVKSPQFVFFFVKVLMIYY